MLLPEVPQDEQNCRDRDCEYPVHPEFLRYRSRIRAGLEVKECGAEDCLKLSAKGEEVEGMVLQRRMHRGEISHPEAIWWFVFVSQA